MKHVYLKDFKGADLTSFTLRDRLIFARARCSDGKTTPGMSVDELAIIYKGLELLGPRPLTILETGFCTGTSTRMFMCHVVKYGGEVHSVDVYDKPSVKEEYQDIDIWKHVHLHLGDARCFKGWNPEKKIDFLNIDSEHDLDYVTGEYNSFRDYLIPHHSLIGFHDLTLKSVKEGIKAIREIDELEPIMALDNRASMGYGLFRLQWRDKHDKYEKYALTSDQKDNLVMPMTHDEMVTISSMS